MNKEQFKKKLAVLEQRYNDDQPKRDSCGFNLVLNDMCDSTPEFDKCVVAIQLILGELKVLCSENKVLEDLPGKDMFEEIARGFKVPEDKISKAKDDEMFEIEVEPSTMTDMFEYLKGVLS